jgi:hypothetical protein
MVDDEVAPCDEHKGPKFSSKEDERYRVERSVHPSSEKTLGLLLGHPIRLEKVVPYEVGNDLVCREQAPTAPSGAGTQEP